MVLPEHRENWSALLLMGEAAAGESAPGRWLVAGVPIIERQARAARIAGARRIIIVAESLPEPLATRLKDRAETLVVGDAAALALALQQQADDVLLFAHGLLADGRLVSAMADASGAALACFAASAPDGAERLDRDHHWAGLARADVALVADVAEGLGDWDLAATLLRAVDAAGAVRVDAGQLPLFDAEARGDVPLLWAMPADAGQALAVGGSLLEAEGSPPDVIERWVNRPAGRMLARLLLPGLFSGGQVAMLGKLLLLLAIPGFLAGWPLLALLAMLIAPVVDRAGRLMAQARLEPVPRWPLDGLAGAGLAAAAVMALGLSLPGVMAGLAAAMVALLSAAMVALLLVMMAAIAHWFRWRTGAHMDDRTLLDRRLALLSQPLSLAAWPLLPFALSGLWAAGLLLLLPLMALLAAVRLWRLLVAMDALLPRQAVHHKAGARAGLCG